MLEPPLAGESSPTAGHRADIVAPVAADGQAEPALGVMEYRTVPSRQRHASGHGLLLRDRLLIGIAVLLAYGVVALPGRFSAQPPSHCPIARS